MTTIEEIKEKLAMHGYTDWQSCNVEHQGETFLSSKLTKFGEDVRISIRVYKDSQGGDYFWIFELSRHIPLFEDGSYSPTMFAEIQNIQEDQLKYLPILEARLQGIKSELIYVKADL